MARTHERTFIGCECDPAIKQALADIIASRRSSGKAITESDLIREAVTSFILRSRNTTPVMAVRNDSGGQQ